MEKESAVCTHQHCPFSSFFQRPEEENLYHTGENQSDLEPKWLTKATVSKSSRCPGGGETTYSSNVTLLRELSYPPGTKDTMKTQTHELEHKKSQSIALHGLLLQWDQPGSLASCDTATETIPAQVPSVLQV